MSRVLPAQRPNVNFRSDLSAQRICTEFTDIIRTYQAGLTQSGTVLRASMTCLGYEVSIRQMVRNVEWTKGPRRWHGLLPGKSERIEHLLPWYTGLQDAWQECLQAIADFCSWHLAHLQQHIQQLRQTVQQLMQHLSCSLSEHLQQQLHGLQQNMLQIGGGRALAISLLILAAAVAVTAVFRERRRRARRRQRLAEHRAANAESLARQANRFRRALNQFGDEASPSSGQAHVRPDRWHPEPSSEPPQNFTSYRSRHAGETDVAFLSTYDSERLLQHYGESDEEAESSSSAPAWLTDSPASPAQLLPAPHGPGPQNGLSEASPNLDPQDWDEQARTEWSAFMRNSKMVQVPEDGWWDADHSDELINPSQSLQTLDYNA